MLSLDLREGSIIKPVKVKLLATITQLSPSLERLALAGLGERINFSLIMRFQFPRLKSIKLSEFSADHDGKKAMAFWRTHHRLESVSIIQGVGRWFSDDVDSSLLPNLRHLKVNTQVICFVPQACSAGIGRVFRRESISLNSSSS